MFDTLLVSSNSRAGRNAKSLFVSFGLHALVIAALVIVPLVYYDALPKMELMTMLAAPRPATAKPPTPPSPPPKPIERTQKQIVRLEEFVVPTEIPLEIPPPDEELPLFSGVLATTGGTPGGVPQGAIGRVPGAVEVHAPAVPPPPPPPPKKKLPRRVGGDVLTSRLILRVTPVYPDLAVRARVEGDVALTITVDERGQVASIQNVRGNQLLRQAAIDAVRQWKYSPTLLNGEPVPVLATITVHFRLRPR